MIRFIIFSPIEIFINFLFSLNVLFFGSFFVIFLFDFVRNLVMNGWICRFE
jgi:hypothetical protein